LETHVSFVIMDGSRAERRSLHAPLILEGVKGKLIDDPSFWKKLAGSHEGRALRGMDGEVVPRGLRDDKLPSKRQNTKAKNFKRSKFGAIRRAKGLGKIASKKIFKGNAG
jgi:hypothetical protein